MEHKAQGTVDGFFYLDGKGPAELNRGGERALTAAEDAMKLMEA